MMKFLTSPASLVGAWLAAALLFSAYLGVVANDVSPPARAAPHPAPMRLATPAEPLRAAAPAATCPKQPLLQARDGSDGTFALRSALASGAQVRPGAFVVVAREAADAGRVRDAEVALLAACHLEERAAGAQTATVADLKSELGQYYLRQAQAEGNVNAREELLQRASALFADSVAAYAAALGPGASKTERAREQLAAVNEPGAREDLRQVAAEPLPTAVMGAARLRSEDTSAAPQGGCDGSAAQRLVCSDPELAQLDRDLRRLHAQAASVTRDPAGMRRRDSMALAREAGCQDKGCLRRWFAQRRSQLLGEF